MQEVWGKGPPTGRRAPRKKVPNLQFCHFGPYSAPPCSLYLDECWQCFYGVLYYVQCALGLPSLAPLALRVGKMWTPEHRGERDTRKRSETGELRRRVPTSAEDIADVFLHLDVVPEVV